MKRPRQAAPPLQPAASSRDAAFHADASRRWPHDLRWARARHPTLSDITQLADLLPISMRAQTLEPPPEATLFEINDCRGVPPELVSELGLSLDRDSQDFDSYVAPAAHAVRTRMAYYQHWKTFATYAFVHGRLHEALPAPSTLIKAFMWSLIRCGLKPGTLVLYLYAIVDRHARYHQPLSVSKRDLKQWTTAFERLCGCPKVDRLAITAAHLRAALHLPRTRLRDIRDTLIVAVGTLCALRVSELTQLDLCDVLFDFDAPGIMALRIKKRKNDTKRAGLWPRIGLPANPAHDVQMLARQWMAHAGLQVHPACEKGRHPRSACRACGSFFTRLEGNSGRAYPVGHRLHGIQRRTVTEAVRHTLGRLNIDHHLFSGISMRRGGLSTALEGGVPSDLYELQSGHASDAWKSYVRAGRVSLLLRFYESFAL
jgi:hypothetical protein